MITRSQVVAALIQEVEAVFPDAEHYKGKITENYTVPAFLYLPVTSVRSMANAFLEEVVQEVQVIYFGVNDGYGTEDFSDQSKAEEKICSLLQKGYLKVADRKIHLSYETGDQDAHLSILIRLSYRQEITRRQETAEQTETIYLTQKEG